MGLVAGAPVAPVAPVLVSGFLPNQPDRKPKRPPPFCFLVPDLALRLLMRVTLVLRLDMIIINNYILNEDINI
jgi:hypothetical protein